MAINYSVVMMPELPRVPHHTDNCGPLSDCRYSGSKLTDEQYMACEEHDCCGFCYAVARLRYLTDKDLQRLSRVVGDLLLYSLSKRLIENGLEE
jgi:hypothetical protein